MRARGHRRGWRGGGGLPVLWKRGVRARMRWRGSYASRLREGDACKRASAVMAGAATPPSVLPRPSAEWQPAQAMATEDMVLSPMVMSDWGPFMYIARPRSSGVGVTESMASMMAWALVRQ